jgi:hypothetical protein
MTTLREGKSGHIPQELGRLPQSQPASSARMSGDSGKHGLSNNWRGFCIHITEHFTFAVVHRGPTHFFFAKTAFSSPKSCTHVFSIDCSSLVDFLL